MDSVFPEQKTKRCAVRVISSSMTFILWVYTCELMPICSLQGFLTNTLPFRAKFPVASIQCHLIRDDTAPFEVILDGCFP